jgi:hypothetical protein
MMNVRMYWASFTAKVYDGETKKKSNAAMLNNEAKIEASRPNLDTINTSPNKYTIIKLANSKCPDINQPSH